MRKFLSIFLALAMTLSLLPTFAMAEEESEVEPSGNVAELTYKIDNDTTVTIGYSTLTEAINAANESAKTDQTIKLLENLTYSDATCFDIKKEFTLDLSGHSIDALANGGQGATHFIRIENGGDLTIKDSSEDKNGSITARYNGNSTLNVIEVMSGGVLTMENGKIQNAGAGATNFGSVSVYIRQGGFFTLNGGNIHSEAITVKRKVSPVWNRGTMIMNGGSITTNADYVDAGITNDGNGELTINSGEITALSKGSAINSSGSNASVTVNGGSFKGALKANWMGDGVVGIYDGTNTVVSTSVPTEYVANLNGKVYYTGEGGADKAFANAANGDVLTLRAALTSAAKEKKLALNATLTVTSEDGASFDSAKIVPDTRCRVEMTAISEATTKYTAVVDEKQAQAKIGDEYYRTLGDANIAAKDGNTIVVLRDISNTGYLSFSKEITLDLNGHKIESTKRYNSPTGSFATSATVIKFSGTGKTLTITDNSESRNGAVINTAASDYGYALVATKGTIKVEAGTFRGTSADSTLYKTSGSFSITGGAFLTNPTDYLTSCLTASLKDGMYVVRANHNMTHHDAVTATCTEQGHNAYYTCENCGKTYKDEGGTQETTIDAEMIPATGHSWGSWEKVDDEQHKRVCGNDVNHVETAAHTWNDGEVAKAATCKEAGEMTYTCTVCNATKTEVIPMRGEHTLQLVPEVPATCGESGTEAYYKCSVCGRMFEDMTCDVEYTEYPPAIRPTGEHTFGGWTVTKQATYTEKGEREHTCTVCHNTYTEEIPMLTPSSDSSSSSGSTTTKTETTTNPDGSTTKTETKADGTTVETTTGKDGTTTKTESKTETKSDGSKVETKTETVTAKDGSKTESKTETTTAADGSKTETKSETKTAADGTKTETESKTETKADGTTTGTETKKTTDVNGSTGTTTTTTKNGNTKTEAEAKISEKAAEEAKKNDAPVTAPVEVKAGESPDSAPTVKIELPENAGKTKVEIPVSNVNSGTVAVIVNEDGTEEIVKNAIVTENGVVLGVEGNTTVKIIDNSKDFIDTRNHWSRDEVNFVAARELFNGVGNNLFGVSGDMTRGMVNTVLARLAGEDTAGGANWYDKGTEWAKKNGITDGTNPTANVTREQLAAMLYRFAGSPAVSGELSFADADRVSGYAKDALLWAVQNGILNGTGNNLVAPKNSAERAQVAAMMARYLKNVG